MGVGTRVVLLLEAMGGAGRESDSLAGKGGGRALDSLGGKGSTSARIGIYQTSSTLAASQS